MQIRPASQSDLASIAKIQDSSAQAAAWGEADYARLAANPQGMILVAQQVGATPGKIIGFAAFHRVGEEAELWNLAVVPQHRRRGVAKALFQEAVQRLHEAGTTRIFLEVRASNTRAMGLYEAVGFKSFVRRKDYYQNPREDALVFVLDLIPNSRK